MNPQARTGEGARANSVGLVGPDLDKRDSAHRAGPGIGYGLLALTSRPRTTVMDLSLDPDFFAVLTGSYRRRLGAALVPEGADAAWLYGQAPFVVLAHDGGADPRFVYANRAAQACFGYDRDALVGLPSRLSAEAPERAERQRLLDAVARDGFTRGYRGLRIAKGGRRFWIEQAVVWQLDRDGVSVGQAATFSEWRDA